MRLFIWTLFCTAAIVPGACALQAQAPPDTGEAARMVVSLIDENYLDAKSNPAWKDAKRALRDARFESAVAAYPAIGQQLARLQDPELHLLSAAEFRATEDELNAKSIGTGLVDFAIDRVPSGEARVIAPIGDSPAARAGIRARDLIVSIDGHPTRAMDHQQVMDALRTGRHGKVTLVIERESRRHVVVLAPSSSPFHAVQFSRRTYRGKTIGYIRVLLFTVDAGQRVRNAVSVLSRQGATGFILDLRSDPGGILDSARGAASAFASGTLGTMVRSSGRPQPVQTEGVPLTGKPLVVLIDGGTASASEFLAGGLQDLRRAVLVGAPSFGRGQSRTYFSLTDGYGILVPTAQLRTLSGRTFIPNGLHPDVEVADDYVPPSLIATEHDGQFLRAIAVLLGG